MLCSKHSIQETSQSAQSWKQFTSRFLMVCLTLIAAFSMQLQEANAQNIIKDFLKDNQVTIDPNKGLQITPKVICPAPLKPNATSTKCICPAPMKWQNGKCTHVIQVICNPPQFIQGNKCVCPNNLQKVGNQCLPKIIPIQCNAPFVPNNSKTKCVCPFGTKYSGGTCIALNPQIICKAPFVPSNSGTKCVCPAGFRKSGGTCVPKVATISCNFPFVKIHLDKFSDVPKATHFLASFP